MNTLHVQVLGSLHLKYNNQTISHISTPKLQSVLVYLLLNCQTPQARYYAAAALWPTSTDSQARTNLRKYLYQLRQALPDAGHYLSTDNNTVQWQPVIPYSFDVAEFDKAIEDAQHAHRNKVTSDRQAALTNAIEIYRGDLLTDCYDEWIAQPRQRLSRTYMRALAELAILHEKQRDYATAILYLQRLLEYDPLRETTYRHLMRLHALNGDRGKALQIFEQCRRVMEHEFDTEPGPATQSVYERLLATKHQIDWHKPRTEQSIPLVGRQAEWEKLQVAWQKAVKHKPHFALINGVAGIGKTRLAEEVISWANKQGYTTVTTHTYAVEKPLAYASLIGWLRTNTPQSIFSSLDNIWLTELARLLPELLVERPELPRPEPLTENWQRQRLFEAIGQVVLAIDQSLILFIDDLQWCDEQTLAWLHYLMKIDFQSKVLVLGTLRPEETGSEHSLMNLLGELRRSNQMTEIALEPLDQTESVMLATQALGRTLDIDEQEQLYRETEGNPLFIVEMLRAEPSLSQMPDTVQAVIKRRLRQLSPEAQAMAGLCAVIGREFTLTVIMQVSQHDEVGLVSALDELCHRYLICEQGGDSYNFTHDKIREVAYSNLSQAHRRLLHRRVAEALEATPDASKFAGELAYHYTEAGKTEKAVQYRFIAGKKMLSLAAYREAFEHLQQGLELVRTLPDTPDRTQSELQFLIELGASAAPWKGFIAPDVQQIYSDAIHLLADLPQNSELIPVIYGLGSFYMLQGKWKTGFAFGEQCLSLAQTTNDPTALMLAHALLGCTSCYMGKLRSALDHLKSSLSYYNYASLPGTRVDHRVLCNSFMSMALWILGYAEQANTTMQIALSVAHEKKVPSGLAVALTYAAQVSLLRREPELAQKFSEESIALCNKYELRQWLSASNVIHGWALARQGQTEQGIQQIRSGMATLASMVRLDAYTYPILAEAHAMADDMDKCHDALNRALTQATLTDVRCFESSTLRIKGDLLLRSGASSEEVELAYQQAIEFAQAQEAKSFELQATIPLCRLYQQQGKIIEARQMLSEIYNWFTEGFDTPDLRDARTLLDELT